MKLFPPFRLDAANHCLWRGQERVPLAPKAFDLLRYLVESADRLVSKEEILDALWPETYVNPEVVKKYVLEIRKALGDQSAKPVFVATVRKRGYRFIAAVREESPSAPAEAAAGVGRPMVGREAAMADLQDCLGRASQARRQVVFVAADAGVGKTTLVDAFLRQAGSGPELQIAHGQCVEGFGGKEPYYPILEALGQVIKSAERGPVMRALARRAPTWLMQFPSRLTAGERQALQREIFGTTRERMVREICEALEAATTEILLVLILEDMHWVDLSTLDVVSALARRRGPAKLMLVATYRPEDIVVAANPLKQLKQDLLVHGLCSEIVLERLEDFHVAEYLATEFAGGSLPAGLATLIHRRSGGNALFMVAIVEDMRKRGLIARDRGRWALAAPLEAIDPSLVPETLQQMLQLQFEQLSVPEQRILGAASVAGERFSAYAVAAMLEMPAEWVEEHCERLADRQRFVRSAGIYELPNGAESAHYEFRHSLHRDALYRGLSDVNRSKLHRRLGEQLKILCGPGKTALASELALHFEKGRAYEDAVHYLIRAAENAADRFAYRESIRILEHALELLARADANRRAESEIQILELIGDAHYWLGAMQDCARAHEAQAARAAQEALRSAEVNALSCLVRPYGFIDPDRGIAAIERAVDISAGLADPVLHARSQMLAACTRLLYDNWHREDADRCAAANQTLRGLGSVGLPAYHEMLYGHVQSLAGNYDEALRIAETGVPGTNQPSNLMAFLFALSGKTVALLYSGRLGELLNVVRVGVALAEKSGNVPWLFILREAWLRTLVLDFSGAKRLCDTLALVGTENPRGQPEAIARFAAGYAELDGGHYDRARRNFQEICDPQVTPKFFLHWHWRVRARIGLSDVWLASGDLGRARGEADRSVEAALASADPNLHALAWEVAARVAMAEGDWAGAADKLRKGLAVLERNEIPTTAWRVHATAWDWRRRIGNGEAAGIHRRHAEAILLQLADSFEPDEPLREAFLSAASIRRIRETAAAQVQ